MGSDTSRRGPAQPRPGISAALAQDAQGSMPVRGAGRRRRAPPQEAARVPTARRARRAPLKWPQLHTPPRG